MCEQRVVVVQRGGTTLGSLNDSPQRRRVSHDEDGAFRSSE
jgi:hypothetical protein